MEGLQSAFETSALRTSKIVCPNTCQLRVLFPPTCSTGAIRQWDRFDCIWWVVILFFVVAGVGVDEGVDMSRTYMTRATVLSLAP